MIPRMNRQWINRTTAYLSENIRFVVLSLILLLGILVGALLIRNSLLTDSFDPLTLVSRYIDARSAGGIVGVYFQSFFSSFIYLVILYFSGLFLFGIVPCMLIPWMRGLGIGVICGYLYSVHGMQGAAFSFLIILPCTFLQCVVLLIASKDALRFSVGMFKHYTHSTYHPLENDIFKRYTIHFCVMTIFTALIAIPDTLLSHVFINIFGF